MATKRQTKKTARRVKTRPQLVGDVTYIEVPHPAASAMNKDRPVSTLIQAQLKHMHHAERARLPKSKRDGRDPKDIRTEGEAASYIAAVTQVLHPHSPKRAKSKAAR
jgi:hypothetical protein